MNATNKTDATRLEEIRTRALRYDDLGNAKNAAEHHVKPVHAILGDDEKIWLVRPADAAWMHARGFEYAF